MESRKSQAYISQKRFTEHINLVDNNIIFYRGVRRNNEKLNILVPRSLPQKKRVNSVLRFAENPLTQTQYLIFHSHHPLEHKLGAIQTLHQQEETTRRQIWRPKTEEQSDIKRPSRACGYPGWAFIKIATKCTKKTPYRESQTVVPLIIEPCLMELYCHPICSWSFSDLKRFSSRHKIPAF